MLAMAESIFGLFPIISTPQVDKKVPLRRCLILIPQLEAVVSDVSMVYITTSAYIVHRCMPLADFMPLAN